MLEEWTPIEEFPDYSVSNMGNVFNHVKDYMMKYSYVQYNIPTVGLYLSGRQYRRSVPMLVAHAWLPRPPRKDFTTPIHLDGDRSNCQAVNLMWRPRWFAIDFHKERRQTSFPDWNTKKAKIEILDTGEVFSHPSEIAEKYGVLETHVHDSILNGTAVFPQWYKFRYFRNNI